MHFLAGVLKKKPIKVASFSNHVFEENEESRSRVYP